MTSEELAQLLERFPLERASGRTLDETVDMQIQVLLARIEALTEMLRRAGRDENAHLASRILLSDLTAVAVHFRGRTNTMRSTLAEVRALPRNQLTASNAEPEFFIVANQSS